jgi:hypothetical protein
MIASLFKRKRAMVCLNLLKGNPVAVTRLLMRPLQTIAGSSREAQHRRAPQRD